MSAIDVQNAKQIRDPMDVLITLSLGTDIAMTYSGYSSAKVADGVLNQSSWPMRGLADLQGNGFPLDGSRVLYNPNTSPSQTNGKLGVRGNVGQPVSITATGEEAIAALAIYVTGAASVTLNGETTEITGNHVTLRLLNTTAALTFQPSSEDRRIEIITVLPEADFVINNDNLIKATVSLRSDLSIINPTLPESELNVEVYQDLDISEAVASIPEDTPITYQAGYPGDMSPVRKFYVSGQVTWADNVLNIHAVDAVHFLDKEIGPLGFWSLRAGYQETSPTKLTDTLAISIKNCGVDAQTEVILFRMVPFAGAVYKATEVPSEVTLRQFLAFASNVFKIEHIPGSCVWRDNPPAEVDYWVNYVDAGIPKLNTVKKSVQWAVSEEDCASVLQHADRKISEILVDYSTVEVLKHSYPMWDGAGEGGSVTWQKNGPAFLNFDKPMDVFMIGLKTSDIPSVTPSTTGRTAIPILPVTESGKPVAYPELEMVTYPCRLMGDGGSWIDSTRRSQVGDTIITDSTPQSLVDDRGSKVFSQVVPETAGYNESLDWKWRNQNAAWEGLVTAGYISAEDDTATLKILGTTIQSEKMNKQYVSPHTDAGVSVDIKSAINGIVEIYNPSTSRELKVFPDMAFESLFNRSPITCSFTWKGDPRIQPRDVFTFHRLDGTDEEWTFENITITHEGGGTSAEITARKGIV